MATNALYGVTDLSCVCRGCETATLTVDRLLGHSFQTSKVPRDCLKVGLDGTHSSSLKPYNAFVAVS